MTSASEDPPMPGRPVSATLHEGPIPDTDIDFNSVAGLEQLGRLMDSQFEIPGTGIRFGLDALIGLIPGLGDVAGGLVSLYIVGSAARYGVSRVTIARMALNLAGDALLGSLPVVGDLFDVGFKANNRNVALLQRHVAASPTDQRNARRADGAFVGAILFVLVLVLAGGMALTALWIWLLMKLFQLA
jgi:hypothetical protein